MATFELTGPDGGTYHVDAPNESAALDAFQKFTGSAPAPDKYQQAAQDEQTNLAAKGIDEGAGYTRRLAHGYTLGADSTLLAGALALPEAIKRGVGLGEGYNYAKAREDQIMGDARANTGLLGSGVEMLGGAVQGGALTSGLGTLARGAGGALEATAQNGLSASRLLSATPGLFGRTAAAAADTAGLGGFAGGMEGNSLSERLGNATSGAIGGAVLGGAMPLTAATVGAVASPFISNVMAKINPAGYAARQVARGIVESGKPTADIAQAVNQAADEGQGVYNVADAMGNAGQRLLSTVTRSPGEGRTAVVNALEARQAGQGRRVANALNEGFGSPQTAAQTETALTGARDTAADAQYGAVRANADSPVDVTPAIAHLDATLGPAADQMLANNGSAAANDSVESVLLGFRNRLARVNPDDFSAVQRIRGDMADTAQNATQNGYGNKARLIRGALGHLDSAMENASTGYRAANANFAQASRNIGSVQAGTDAAMRGRVEDTIPAYRALPAEGQAAWRAGYVDPLIEAAQKSPMGSNAARPLSNSAFQDEAAVMAPMRTQAQMQRRLGREQTMFDTRNAAMGGSKTVDNLNDYDAMGIDPSVVGHVIAGNYAGAVRSLIHAGANKLTGNTPAVRAVVANILLQRGANVTGASLDALVGQTIRRIQFMQQLSMGGQRVAAGALAVTPSATKRPPPIFARKN
jgi:hypothetical protein